MLQGTQVRDAITALSLYFPIESRATQELQKSLADKIMYEVTCVPCATYEGIGFLFLLHTYKRFGYKRARFQNKPSKRKAKLHLKLLSGLSVDFLIQIFEQGKPIIPLWS